MWLVRRNQARWILACDACCQPIDPYTPEIKSFWDQIDRVFCQSCITAFCGRYDASNRALTTCLRAVSRRRKRRSAYAVFSDEQQALYREKRAYLARVRAKSNARLKAEPHRLNPAALPMGRCGKRGAYQLDHVVPLSLCWDYWVAEEDAASIENLQVVPWLVNILRTPWFSFERLLGLPP